MQIGDVPHYRTHVAGIGGFADRGKKSPDGFFFLVLFRAAVFADDDRDSFIHIGGFQEIHVPVQFGVVVVCAPSGTHLAP